jgi:ribokinase
MSQKDIEVIGLGAPNIDCLYRVPRILTDGEAVVDEFSLAPGGSAANTIYGLARLGITTSFIGAIGDDQGGRTLLQDFEAVGVDTQHIKVEPQAKTGSVLCLSDKQAGRALYVSPGANNLLGTEDIDVNYINRATVLHLSSFAHGAQFDLQLKLIQGLDPSVKISFAPGALYAARGLPALAPLLKKTHILFINRDELRQLTGEELEKGVQLCLERGCRIVAVTLGEGQVVKGESRAVCYLVTGKKEYLIESQQASEVMDTTGAGDAFAAGFLYGWLKGKDPQQCGYLGDLMASFCIAHTGARAGLPAPTELARRYKKLYGQRR